MAASLALLPTNIGSAATVADGRAPIPWFGMTSTASIGPNGATRPSLALFRLAWTAARGALRQIQRMSSQLRVTTALRGGRGRWGGACGDGIAVDGDDAFRSANRHSRSLSPQEEAVPCWSGTGQRTSRPLNHHTGSGRWSLWT